MTPLMMAATRYYEVDDDDQFIYDDNEMEAKPLAGSR
jgi:hypothetical protein